MTDTRSHYDTHLGPIYEWMTGPFEAAILPSTRLFEELNLVPGSSGVAVDLGCGHGLQAVPLANLGYRVIAIDTCPRLLRQLQVHAGSLAIEIIESDITECAEQIPAEIDLAVCMGDTLTHLRSRDDVATLIRQLAAVLAPSGMFVTTFRDYVTSPLEGDQRFIPVKSDENRILTCFLEYREDFVRVHDLVHERTERGWTQALSSYDKLRLDPKWVVDVMKASGLGITLDRTERGLVTLVASVGTGNTEAR